MTPFYRSSSPVVHSYSQPRLLECLALGLLFSVCQFVPQISPVWNFSKSTEVSPFCPGKPQNVYLPLATLGCL